MTQPNCIDCNEHYIDCQCVKTAGGSFSAVFTGYARPRTRGELVNKLKEGVACEVASHVASMTAITLSGWLDFDKYTVRPSENKGWAVFET